MGMECNETWVLVIIFGTQQNSGPKIEMTVENLACPRQHTAQGGSRYWDALAGGKRSRRRKGEGHGLERSGGRGEGG